MQGMLKHVGTTGANKNANKRCNALNEKEAVLCARKVPFSHGISEARKRFIDKLIKSRNLNLRRRRWQGNKK